MKNLLFLIFALTTQFVISGPSNNTIGTFRIKGKVLNSKEKTWELAKTEFLGNKIFKIDLQPDGSFDKILPLDGKQNLYLYLNNDAITIYVQPDDIIQLSWDERNFKKSFKIDGQSRLRTREIQLNLRQYNEFREPTMALMRKLGEMRNTADSLKYKLINDQYNQQLNLILCDTFPLTANTSKFVYEKYYYYTDLLRSNKLLAKYSLTSKIDLSNKSNAALIKTFIPGPNQYKGLVDKIFFECPGYRDFLFNYVRFGNELFNMYRIGDYTQKSDIAPFAPGLKDYYNGLAALNIYPIRDWFITKVIINSFGVYTFDESEKILNDFLPRCKTQIYKDTLVAFYTMVKRFKSGIQAPPFTLKNEYGKPVSLNDFKGKIIYLDFWGVGCGPCRYEIMNYVQKLHEKYADKDVVFINICVDSDEKTWKETLIETKLNGINLIAEGWTNNPVCKDYNINGLPHYILLDNQGRFINSNMARPSEIMKGQNTELDNLLLIK